MIQDRVTVTMERQQELVCDPFPMTLSDQFTKISRSWYYSTSINSKMVQHMAILTMADRK